MSKMVSYKISSHPNLQMNRDEPGLTNVSASFQRHLKHLEHLESRRSEKFSDPDVRNFIFQLMHDYKSAVVELNDLRNSGFQQSKNRIPVIAEKIAAAQLATSIGAAFDRAIEFERYRLMFEQTPSDELAARLAPEIHPTGITDPHEEG